MGQCYFCILSPSHKSKANKEKGKGDFIKFMKFSLFVTKSLKNWQSFTKAVGNFGMVCIYRQYGKQNIGHMANRKVNIHSPGDEVMGSYL